MSPISLLLTDYNAQLFGLPTWQKTDWLQQTKVESAEEELFKNSHLRTPDSSTWLHSTLNDSTPQGPTHCWRYLQRARIAGTVLYCYLTATERSISLKAITLISSWIHHVMLSLRSCFWSCISPSFSVSDVIMPHESYTVNWISLKGNSLPKK